MGAIAQRLADVVVVTSDNPRGEQPEAIIDDVIQGISEDYIRMSDRAEAIGAALDLAAPGDTVLVAGKGHERYQEINGCRVPFCDREVVEAWCDAKGLAR
jgi:UDP-N-acetylmuramoyl-L-alanyl-D-glutamate--2,6-diaminopimelate ligase